MAKPLVAPPDPERLIVDLLTGLLASRGEDVTVGVEVPSTWTTGQKPHVQVALDGTPTVQYPVLWVATMRVTSWADGPTEAKDRANLCQALLLAHTGADGLAGCLPGTGVLPARDNATDAALASITVRAKLRGLPL